MTGAPGGGADAQALATAAGGPSSGSSVPAGRTLPTALRIDLVGRDCARRRLARVDGQVEADATNAFGLEEATPIYFSARP